MFPNTNSASLNDHKTKNAHIHTSKHHQRTKTKQTANEAANQSFPNLPTTSSLKPNSWTSQHIIASYISPVFACHFWNIKIINIATSQLLVFNPFHKMSARKYVWWFTYFEMMKCWKTWDNILQYFHWSLSSSTPQPCSRHQRSHRVHVSRSRAQRPLSGQQKWSRLVVHVRSSCWQSCPVLPTKRMMKLAGTSSLWWNLEGKSW